MIARGAASLSEDLFPCLAFLTLLGLVLCKCWRLLLPKAHLHPRPLIGNPMDKQKEDVIIAMKKIKHSSLVLDKERSSFFLTIAELLLKLVTGKLEGCNRFNILVIGRKAVGKTSMLLAIMSGCAFLQQYNRQRIIVVRIDCTLPDHSSLIDRAYKLSKIKKPESYGFEAEQLAEVAKLYGYRFVFLVDEFQAVYKRGWSQEDATLFISSVSSLLESTSGQFFLVVTGSGSELRRLAYGKFKGDTSPYPNYYGRDLNSTKLQPVFMMPFQDVSAFCELCAQYEIVDVVTAFCKSAGYPGLLTRVSSSADYTLGARSFASNKILQAMAKWRIIDVDEGKDDLTSLMRQIPIRWQDVVQEVEVETNQTIDFAIGYELMDDGLILLTHSAMSDTTVIFATNQVYYDVLSSMNSNHEASLTRAGQCCS